MAKWVSPKRIRDGFLAWQCLIRQAAMREEGGRPSPGMRPRVLDTAGRELAPALTVLLIPKEPEESTAFFRFQVMKTQDPRDVYERALVYLQADYFQSPKTFSDRLVVVLPAELLARRIADCHRRLHLRVQPVPAALLHLLQGARTQARQRRPRSGDLAQPGVQSRTARHGAGHYLQARLGIGRGLRVCRSQGRALARPCCAGADGS